jgi:hypothetical protein
MSVDSGVEKVAERWKDIEDEYRQGSDRPLSAYAGIIGAYAGTVVTLAAVAAVRSVKAADLALFGVATHKLARTIAKDTIASPIRAPFTRYEGSSGPAELKEDVRGTGWRKAVGELVSCPFCLGQWIGTGFVFGAMFAPRFTRTVAATFVIHAASDALQFAYTGLEQVTGDAGDGEG